MNRWECQSNSMLIAILIILIVSSHCDADIGNITQVMPKSIPNGVKDILLELKEPLFNASWPKQKNQNPFVWYASYGSNMNMERFLCYIEGGQIAGMQKPCDGSRDKTRPKSIKWRTIHYRMFFGRKRTKTWGIGGVAFLDFKKNWKNKAYIRMFKITLEQFNDVLKQENDRKHEMVSPLITLTDLKSIMKEKFKFVSALKKGWYRTVLYLGQTQNLPVLTFTCPPLMLEDFKSEKLPVCPPSKAYADVITKALVEEGKMTPDVVSAYLKDCYEKPLKGPIKNHTCCWSPGEYCRSSLPF